MASKALERLESSTEVISEIRQSMQLMQEHSSHCDTVLEAEQEKNAELELAMGKVKQENDRLLDKVESLEASVTSYDIKVHDLTRKVCCNNAALRDTCHYASGVGAQSGCSCCRVTLTTR